MLTLNEIKLKLEIIKLLSLCRVAAKELSSLEDLIIDNIDNNFKRSEMLQSALNYKTDFNYIYEYPDLNEDFLELTSLLKEKNENKKEKEFY